MMAVANSVTSFMYPISISKDNMQYYQEYLRVNKLRDGRFSTNGQGKHEFVAIAPGPSKLGLYFRCEELVDFRHSQDMEDAESQQQPHVQETTTLLYRRFKKTDTTLRVYLEKQVKRYIAGLKRQRLKAEAKNVTMLWKNFKDCVLSNTPVISPEPIATPEPYAWEEAVQAAIDALPAKLKNVKKQAQQKLDAIGRMPRHADFFFWDDLNSFALLELRR
jgi:hypothetical protein